MFYYVQQQHNNGKGYPTPREAVMDEYGAVVEWWLVIEKT